MENALTLDVNDMLRRGVLARGSCTRGVISWLGPLAIGMNATTTH